MDLGLKEKIVLVTGGTKGIGRACAALFVAEGARVAITARSADAVSAEAEVLGCALGIPADLSHADAAASMLAEVQDQVGEIDILVNCAGAARRRTPEELTPAAYREAMDAKFFPYINVTDLLIKRMAERGAGVIVNVIGNGGRVASPIHLAGGSANAALMLVTAGLAHTYAEYGVRVVGLNPALTNTERVADGVKADAARLGISEEAAYARGQKSFPLGRMAEPDEIANVVAFLASDRASYVTGTNITMDGAKYPTVV